MTLYDTTLHERRYHAAFGADFRPAFDHWLGSSDRGSLGFRRAAHEPLFVEHYLDAPIELKVSDALGRQVNRDVIVEIGNFAAGNAMAMIDLWGHAANDLGGANEVAVATLTAPLRRMLERVGVPLVELGRARAECLGAAAATWGSYYEQDPRVFAGVIADGQLALSKFFSLRRGSTCQ